MQVLTTIKSLKLYNMRFSLLGLPLLFALRASCQPLEEAAGLMEREAGVDGALDENLVKRDQAGVCERQSSGLIARTNDGTVLYGGYPEMPLCKRCKDLRMSSTGTLLGTLFGHWL